MTNPERRSILKSAETPGGAGGKKDARRGAIWHFGQAGLAWRVMEVYDAFYGSGRRSVPTSFCYDFFWNAHNCGDAFFNGELGASLVEANAGIGVHIGGYGIVVGLNGYAGSVGAEAKFGVKDGAFVFDVGASTPAGGGFYIKIGKVKEDYDNL